ncbi:MAG: hypothetical protein JXA22_05640 [Candidatus Thermoplasmatota archaeon]|nr:hypothetical protein [Candidatus Thermoplasmatota archaeon]
MGWDWTTFWYVLVIGLLLVALVLVMIWYLQLRKKRKMEPSHIELYFDEHFRGMIGEWDLTSRDRIKEFKNEMGKKLGKVGSDIENLEKRRTTLDKRMSTLETQLGELEGI